ncbi:hypothetical protein GCM10025859_24720 [Alicyclobacillus fastidiosus]|nr:hypothetical protein GCM10025859_24720 [Alicyclobacillus fastidiosus]
MEDTQHFSAWLRSLPAIVYTTYRICYKSISGMMSRQNWIIECASFSELPIITSQMLKLCPNQAGKETLFTIEHKSQEVVEFI